MKKLVSLVFTVVLSLAVFNVMATDKNSKKTKASKKVKVVKSVKQVNNTLLYAKSKDGKVTQLKAVTVADLKNKRQKAATK